MLSQEDLYSELTPNQKLCVEVLNKQERVTSQPYYSTIEVIAEQAGNAPGPYTYTVSRGEEYRAFSYGVRQQGIAAGFPADFGNMTFAETNLQDKGQTNNGQSVIIFGIAAMVNPGGIYKVIDTDTTGIGKRFADARLAAQLATNASVSLRLGGDETILRLGKLGAIPCHGGLMGQGQDSLAAQALVGGRFPFGFMNNGWPQNVNFMRLPEGLVWKPPSFPDSNLEILLRIERDIVLYSGGTQFIGAGDEDEDPVAGVRGYKYPDALVCPITFYLMGWVMARRSQVV